MKAIHLIPAATAALLLVAGGAQAQSLNSNQRNNATIRAELNSTIANVTGDVSATSAAIANSMSMEGERAGNISNVQNFWGDARSILNANNFSDITGDLSLTSAAIANSASITTKLGAAQITNVQNASIDPTATLNSSVNRVRGDVEATAAALSNSASIDSRLAGLTSTQQNGAGVYAYLNTGVRDVTGSVQATAAAIGNSLSVTGF
jgi:outer membrane murein-binding lipoprotein Lpp